MNSDVMTNEPLGMLKTDNLLSGYPFIG